MSAGPAGARMSSGSPVGSSASLHQRSLAHLRVSRRALAEVHPTIRRDRTEGRAGAVRRGERVIDPELPAAAWAGEPDPLTERERQALWRAGEGRSGAEIALSEGTVRNYLSEAISKLGAANRIEAARIARQKGWL